MRRFFKYVGVFLAILILVTIISLLLLDTRGSQFLKKYVPQRIEKLTNERYDLYVDSIDFDLRSISFYIDGFHFDRDTVIQQYSGFHLLDEYDIEINFSSLQIKNFDLIRFLLHGAIELDSFYIKDPEITIQNNLDFDPDQVKEDVSIEKDSTAFQEFVDTTSKILPVLDIGSIAVHNGSFAFFNEVKGFPEFSLSEFSLSLFGVNSKEDVPVSADGFDLQVGDIKLWVDQYLAKVDVRDIQMSKGKLHLGAFRFRYVVDRYKINEIKGYQTSVLDLRLNDIDLTGVDFRRLIADSTLECQKITVDNIYVNDFKDKSHPNINMAYKPMPVEGLINLPLTISVDSVVVNSGEVFVEDQLEQAKLPGELRVVEINGLITNVTNVTEDWKENPWMKLTATAKLMGSGQIKLNMQTRLDDPGFGFSAQGSIGAMPFSDLNQFIERQAFLTIQTGNIKQYDFSFTANAKYSQGTADLEYTKLKLAKLTNYQDILGKTPKTGLLVFAGNTLIPSNRLKTMKSYEPAPIYTERLSYRSFINYTIKNITSGLINSLGFSPKDPKKKADQKKVKEARKLDRQQKREEKKALRQERKKQKKEKN